jgi:uncharacterized membrane protein (UPF0127 family)
MDNFSTSPLTKIIYCFVAISFWAGCADDPPIPKPAPSPAVAQRTAPPAPTDNDPNSKVPEEPFVQEGKLAVFGPDGQQVLRQFDIEIAETQAERARGLMFRRNMLPERGMLFYFDYPAKQSFWMRNTYIPLDIIYIDEQLRVVSIQKNCRILNDTPLPSTGPAQYVLEINGGLSDKLGIQPGTRVGWKNYINNQQSGPAF